MNGFRTLSCAGLLLAFAGIASAGEPAAVLETGGYWRSFRTMRTPLVRVKKGDELKEEPLDGYRKTRWKADGPFPPAAWRGSGFDDADWARVSSFGNSYGGWQSPSLALQCLRGKFMVRDPARASDLSLSVAYRGGIVVYLNGREVGRGNLPEGKLEPGALAEEYPPDAYYYPGNKKLLITGSSVMHRHRDRHELRVRKLDDLKLPAKLLRKGVNVLALEIHRAPYFGPGLRKEDMNHYTVWSTCGLVSAELRGGGAGVEPNVERPRGVQVWNCPITERLNSRAYGNPCEELRPVKLVGAPNGAFSGQVVVSSDVALRGLAVKAGDLVCKENKSRIAAADVKIYYTRRDDRMLLRYQRRVPGGLWDTLLDRPPAEVPPEKDSRGRVSGAVQPVVIKVHVPEDAKAGLYSGEVTVSLAGSRPVKIPVSIKVIGWKLPDPKDYVTTVDLVQSPESLALWYKVPLWSEKHWKLVESSLRLLGEVGNKTVYLPIICRTNQGNSQGLIRWIKEGAGYRYDFKNFDRYLDIAGKYLKPEMVCVYIFDGGKGQRGYSAKVMENRGRPFVSLLDPASGKVSMMEAPKLDSPGAKAFWSPVIAEVRKRLRKRGLLAAAMVGIYSDYGRPNKGMVATLKELMPGARWVVQTHPGDLTATHVHGVPVGFYTQVYIRKYSTLYPWRSAKQQAWRRPVKQGWFIRGFGPSASLSAHRSLPERSFMHHLSGWGRAGADFWPMGQARRAGIKHSTTIAARYPESCWDQLNLDRATEALLAPGPDGAVRTLRFEMVREGLQECEARIFIAKALVDPARRARLGADLAGRCDALLEERVLALKEGSGRLSAEKLFYTAAEVAGKLGK
ncbi:MAG: glycoside hydrolase domain-containing protein [Planctomycetota bacterium]|jgi:hypothetical protein